MEGGIGFSPRFSSVKQVFFDILEHLLPDVGVISYRHCSAYQKLPTYGLSRASEVHQRNPWILHILRMGRRSIIECSALARCNILIIRSRKDQGQGPPRQRHVDNTTPHPTTQPTTTRDTRHDTAPHNKKHTKTHTCTHMHMYTYMKNTCI